MTRRVHDADEARSSHGPHDGDGARSSRWPAWMPRPRLPRRSVRLRLTLLYGSVFLVAGAGLLAITYVLVRRSTGSGVFYARGPSIFFAKNGPPNLALEQTVHVAGISGAQTFLRAGEPVVTLATQGRNRKAAPGHDRKVALPPQAQNGALPAQVQAQTGAGPPSAFALPAPAQVQAQASRLQAVAVLQHNGELHQLIVQSGIALAIMTVVSMGLGWLLAGRALRPLRTITATARRISATNLHERLALEGPNDELTELGNTFDALLARLESSFEAQRQFVANASHELRTPLTLERALLEVALADPNADAASLRHACERALAAGEQQEQIVEALLTLAVSERGIEHREPLLLDEIARDVLATPRPEIERFGLHVEAELADAPTLGDRPLIERLVSNLIDNASRHNESGGWIGVTTSADAHGARIVVSNTGPAIAPSEVERLLEPFQRRDAGRAAERDGLGLGLSIVRAIVRAHRAALSVTPREEGGLRVEVAFPAVGVASTPVATDAVA